MTTRFKSIGMAGGSATAGQSDPSFQTIVVPIVAVASGAAQNTGVFLPINGAYLVTAFLNVFTAEAAAAVKTVDIGTTGSANAILAAVSGAATGLVGSHAVGPLLAGQQITYTLAGADFTGLNSELILTIQTVALTG